MTENIEQICNDFLLLKVNDETFLSANLIGINPNQDSATAIVVKKYFTESVKKIIELKYDGENVTFTFVENNFNISDDQNSRIDKLTESVNNLIILQMDSLSKKIVDVEIYKDKKTNIIFDAWKYLIENTSISVDDNIKEGLKYYKTEDNELTEEQISQKKVVIDWMNKLNARNRIEVEVGDISDLIADVSKRVSMNERLLIRLAHQILTENPMPEEYKTKYTNFLNNYLYAIENNLFKDRTDLEDEAELFTRLMVRFNNITQIVKDEYLDKQ